MSNQARDRRFALAAAACALLLSVAVARQSAAPDEDDPGGAPRPVHVDAAALLEAAGEATRAFLREDAVAARAALDRMEHSTRRLDRERDAGFGSDLLTYEQAFHVTLDRSRESAGKGQLESAFNHFVWVQRACVTCHGIARDQGLLPEGPLSSASPADSGSPSPASGATP